MSSLPFTSVGKVLAAQGLEGQVFVYIFHKKTHWIPQWTCLYVDKNPSSQTPQGIPIESLKTHRRKGKTGFVLCLKDYNNRDLSESLLGHFVFVPVGFLTFRGEDTVFLEQILSYKIIDQTRGPVGHVVGTKDNGFQDLLVGRNDRGQDFLFPFTKPLYRHISWENREIHTDLPYGLLPSENL